MGYNLLDALDPSRNTLARHMAHMGCFAFPFGCVAREGEGGHWALHPKDARHYPAAKACARMSVLFAAGERAADALAKSTGLDVDLVRELISNPMNKGECFFHLDLNDPGMGGVTYSHVPWGMRDVDACEGLAYVHGHEGLDVGGGERLHAGEELWHLVMVISCGCTDRERQAIGGWEEGDATCIFEFPATDPALEHDEVRVHVYAVDYSRRPHGNPSSPEPLGPNAWCMRFTPYGTTHMATWAAILRHVSEGDRERARSLMTSIVENAGSNVLGCHGMAQRLHPQRRRQGREAPVSVQELGGWVGRMCTLRLAGTTTEVARGNAVPSYSAGRVVSMHVGTMGGGYVQYQPDIHDVELVDEGPQMCTRSRCSR